MAISYRYTRQAEARKIHTHGLRENANLFLHSQKRLAKGESTDTGSAIAKTVTHTRGLRENANLCLHSQKCLHRPSGSQLINAWRKCKYSMKQLYTLHLGLYGSEARHLCIWFYLPCCEVICICMNCFGFCLSAVHVYNCFIPLVLPPCISDLLLYSPPPTKFLPGSKWLANSACVRCDQSPSPLYSRPLLSRQQYSGCPVMVQVLGGSSSAKTVSCLFQIAACAVGDQLLP